MHEVPLANGRGIALVDDEDAAAILAHRWYIHEVKGKRYARSGRLLMHRVLAGLTRGDGLEVDHIDGNGLNNCRSNLRVVTHAQNHQNRRQQTGRTSRYRGVSWWTTRGKWTVRVTVNGVVHHGGHFDNEDEAGRRAASLRAELMPYATN